VKLLWIGKQFFKNEFSQKQWEAVKNQQIKDIDQSFESDGSNENTEDQQEDSNDDNENIINYFPNELVEFSRRFDNVQLESIFQQA